ncbi:MAG: hypothetical protein R3190_07080 [Thermoanaerobaculia bacterium]|nr:hypothetical protein [Thermoanaerobaculia bacterium]
MNQLLEWTSWRDTFVSAFTDLGASAAAFLPHLVGAILILLVGWLISRGVEAFARRALRLLGLDRAAGRVGLDATLARANVKLTFSQIVAKMLFWLVLLTFLLSSVETLGLTAVSATVDRLVAFIPRVIGASLIALAGLLMGRLVATLVGSTAAAAGFSGAQRLGFAAQLAVVGLVLVAAVEQLGIATDVLLLPLTVVLATAGLAVGTAFALGARPVVTHILAGHFLKQSLPHGASIEIDGQRGLVERVGAVDTLLCSEERTWTVPNAQLLERVVER